MSTKGFASMAWALRLAGVKVENQAKEQASQSEPFEKQRHQMILFQNDLFFLVSRTLSTPRAIFVVWRGMGWDEGC